MIIGDALFRAGYYNEAKYQWNRALLYEPEKELKENIKFKLKKDFNFSMHSLH